MKIKKKKLIIFSSIFIVLLIIAIAVFSGKEKVEYVTTEIKKQNLVQTVSEIGTVRSSQEIGLNFSQPGKLNLLHVQVGDQVKEGDILAELDYYSLLIRKEEALAALNIAKTNQEKLIKGASYEDIVVLEAQLSQAKSNYDSSVVDLEQVKEIVAENIFQAEKTLSDLKAPNYLVPMSIKQAVDSAKINLENTKKTSQQAINNSQSSLLSSLDYNFSVSKASLDSVKRIMDDEDIENVFSVMNISYKIETNRLYNKAVDNSFDIDNYIKIAKSDPSKDNIRKASDELLFFLSDIFEILNNCFLALDNSITSSSFSQSSLDAFKSTINTNKSSISTAISALQSSYFSFDSAILAYDVNILNAQDAVNKAEAALGDSIVSAENSLSLARINGNQQISGAEARLDSAKKNYDVVKLQLAKLKSPAKSDDLKLAQSQVDQAEANLSLIEKQIEDNIIKSPIDGQVVKISHEVGEQISGSVPVISLLANSNFEVEVFISETDISKVSIGNEVSITFDALGGDYQTSGQVYFIEPASTSISDVIYYKIKINFTEEDLEQNGVIIKPGMTANVDIITNFKENILVAPSRAILLRNGGDRYIRILEGRDFREVPVRVGVSGDQAMIEIISEEIKEGDLAITSIRNN